jgi:UDP-glucose 4-epimerase
MAALRYLITGGAGFVGSNIAARLLETGAKVRVLDNLSTGHETNLKRAGSPSGASAELVIGDIRDLDTVEQSMESVDYVIHQAALPSVPRSVADPEESISVAVNGTLAVLQAARKAGVKRVVYAASSSAYGSSEVLPKSEEHRPEPLSPYAAGKLSAEHLCRAFYECYGLETVALRYFNVFGPNQDPNSPYAAVIPNFISAYIQDRQPVVYGDGRQTRDFTFVENVVNANLLACTAPKAPGHVVNVACGQSISLLQLLDTLSGIFGKSIEPRFEAPRPGDVLHSLADISKARELLGYEVDVSLEEGLEKTVAWFLQT